MNAHDARKILGLGNSFTEEELRKAYRRESKKYHPDLNKSLDAEEKMKKVNSAYEYLKQELKSGNSYSYDTNKGNSYSSNSNKNNYYSYDRPKTSYVDYEFIKYKFEVLNKLSKEQIGEIPKEACSDDETFFEYLNFSNIEVMAYRSLIISIDKCDTKISIDLELEYFYEKQKNRIQAFVNKILYDFYNTYNCYIIDKNWFKNRCENFISRWKLLSQQSRKSVDDAMKFTCNAKNTIVKEFIHKKLDIYVKESNDDTKYYIDLNKSPEDISNILLKTFSIKEILKNQNVIYDVFNKYRKEKLKKYNKFILEKEEKIKNLIKICKKNGFPIDKLKIEELKKEMYELEFNNKYLILENDIQTLLKYKEEAIFKSMIDKCSLYLTCAYRKAKKPLIHEDNFKKALYYLSLVSTKELAVDNIELLEKIKFRDLEKDSGIINKIELNMLPDELRTEKIYKKIKK